MSGPIGFVECLSCAAKPGTPPLCQPCLQNRRTIERLVAELKEAKRLPGWMRFFSFKALSKPGALGAAGAVSASSAPANPASHAPASARGRAGASNGRD